MSEAQFKPETMPILSIDTSGTSHRKASHFLHSLEIMTAYIAESIKAGGKALLHAQSEVERAAHPVLKGNEAVL